MIPFQEQGFSSEEFQFPKEPLGSPLMAALNDRRAVPSLFRPPTAKRRDTLQKRKRSSKEGGGGDDKAMNGCQGFDR